MKAIHTLTALLIIVGGLNWGLIGFAGFDLVATLFGDATPLSRLVYSLVGISAVIQTLHVFMPQRRTAVARS
jgi:uncharacterized membrane protein YuzA (DUF378 family)